MIKDILKNAFLQVNFCSGDKIINDSHPHVATGMTCVLRRVSFFADVVSNTQPNLAWVYNVPGFLAGVLSNTQPSLTWVYNISAGIVSNTQPILAQVYNVPVEFLPRVFCRCKAVVLLV